VNRSALTLVLASASPRRAELLRQLGLDFVQQDSDVDESVRPGEAPFDYVQRLACAKAQQAASLIAANHRPAVILGADTCISIDNQILGKPDNLEQAIDYLTRLAGREHTVYSAVNVLWQNDSQSRVNCSKVSMKAMTQEEIKAYCDSGEPMGKAGGYAIQGLGAMFIERIEGSYSAIMGLPLYETAELLQHAGITIIRNET